MTPELNFIFLLAMAILAPAFFALGLILRHHWQIYAPHQAAAVWLAILYWGAGGTLLTIMILTYFISFV